jgi:alpha-L-fucosidase
MSRKGKDRFPSGSWFWHDWDHSVASKKQITDWLTTADRMNANLLLNVGPMANGKLRPEDVSVLSSLRT